MEKKNFPDVIFTQIRVNKEDSVTILSMELRKKNTLVPRSYLKKKYCENYLTIINVKSALKVKYYNSIGVKCDFIKNRI